MGGLLLIAANYNVLVNNETSSQQSETSFISVSPPALKSVELTWDTPTEREDGTALDDSEIMGYVIEYGYHSRALDKSRMIEGEFGNSFTINRITASELFLRIATLDSDGNQGAFSDIIKVSF